MEDFPFPKREHAEKKLVLLLTFVSEQRWVTRPLPPLAGPPFAILTPCCHSQPTKSCFIRLHKQLKE
ncbi:hypothetical protein EYF80_036778 [Liparis tanakae]|uniref:Uncharacterized protein n=1 Tax=Liparis tanakae TaxID=230148 RepID=A0A4Z2GHJ4_9TELE|nr:hypothetical protein EYF80_036778 [Liparis tanakae]